MIFEQPEFSRVYYVLLWERVAQKEELIESGGFFENPEESDSIFHL